MKSWAWVLIFTLLFSGADLVVPALKGEVANPRAANASEHPRADARLKRSSGVQSPATVAQDFEDSDESTKALLPSFFVYGRYCQMAIKVVARRTLVYFSLIRLALSSSRAPPRVA